MRKVVGYLFVAISATLLGIGAIDLFEIRTFRSHAFTAQATVTELELRGEYDYPILEFVDADGNERRHSQIANSGTVSLKEGSTAAIYYDPGNTNDVRLASFSTLWLPDLALILFGIIGLMGGQALVKQDSSEAVVATPLNDNQEMAVENYQQVGEVWGEVESSPEDDYLEEDGVTAEAVITQKHDRPVPAVRPRKDRWKPDDGQLFGLLKNLIEDPSVSDIIVTDYRNVAVKRGDKTRVVDGLQFANQEEYEDYVDRLLFAADATYSVAKPFVDGMLGPAMRLHAVHPILCEAGPYLSIRISRFQSINLNSLGDFRMGSPEVLSYLRRAVTTGNTLLIGGEVGTGKTTLSRALAACIDPGESILVIEDTPEIQIEHPLVRYIRTREANMSGAGKIAVSTCIRGGLRMAMNRIILGEIRDGEAAEAFVDVCTSGHPGLSTIHARSSADILGRLELLLSRSQPSATHRVLQNQIATALQIVVLLKVCSITGQRRIFEVLEVERDEEGNFASQLLFQYRVRGGQPEWLVNSQSRLEV